MEFKLLETQSLQLLLEMLPQLEAGFAGLPRFEPVNADSVRLKSVLHEVAVKLRDNYPYFHPLYAGQMLKPPHPIARAAYALASWINPNNHSLDSGRASSAMEKEAVAQIAGMFGWQSHLGHLTSGGTMANLEALWVAGQLQPGKKVVASAQAHYTHERISSVLKLPFEKIAVDGRGRMDLAALDDAASGGDIGCVVATLGATGVGAVDPLPGILERQRRYGFRVHVDAAYGGYFTLADNMGESARAVFDAVVRADSVVIDPHKHGLQPYGCGCVLFRDPAVGAFYAHDSPYTYFSSHELHLGEISLECSRPGAAAVALWATQRLLPLVRGGEFADMLSASRRAALDFARRLRADGRFVVPFDPELDIVVWASRPASGKRATASAVSVESQRLFETAAAHDLHLARIELPIEFYADAWPELVRDRETVVSLRSVLMKPEHEKWVDAIVERLVSCAS
jgi:glutamate/tyrosine decarboxylase-like PLP-dependent enzyme